ncbi:outer membrane beta-barrel protein [Candidatus Ruminimicrobiellum ovillum]|uniref:outer membrane beta-barrel protein n=1 Tax=Candidatus Ruminimicrobiellum ovillum TaxID=1947927 RepID=UPI00355990E9
MKKVVLAVLLAVAMVVPAFAAKGDMSVNAKLGLGINNSVSIDMVDDIYYKFDMEMPVSIGAEFFYGLMDNLSVGLGVNYGFDSKFKKSPFPPDIEVGATNIYAAVKPEVKLESNIFSSIYLIGQLGISMLRAEIDDSHAPDLDMKSGLYLGFGIGTIIKDCFIVELVCSSANGTLEKFFLGGEDVDVQYTATTINVGYKFAL